MVVFFHTLCLTLTLCSSVVEVVNIDADTASKAKSGDWVPLPGDGRMIKLVKSTTVFGANQNLSFNEADQRCRTEGGHLASIKSEDDKKFLTALGKKVCDSCEHACIITTLTVVFESAYGAPADYTFELEDFKKRYEEHMCIQMESDTNKVLLGKWSDYVAKENGFVACEK